MADDVQSTATAGGGAVTALFGAAGSRAAAGSYDEAERIARENAALARQATRIKEMQLSRNIFQTLGEQKAQVSSAGFEESGSALDILRSSASQGALTKAINEEQGTITANAYEEQAAQFAGMAKSARSSAIGQGIAGVIEGAAATYGVYALAFA